MTTQARPSGWMQTSALRIASGSALNLRAWFRKAPRERELGEIVLKRAFANCRRLAGWAARSRGYRELACPSRDLFFGSGGPAAMAVRPAQCVTVGEPYCS